MAQTVTKYLDDSKIKVLVYPTQSPDLNSIENLWVYLGKKRGEREIF